MSYEFPVKWHKFTTAEFDAKKAAYIAKYGYTVHVPAFDDILHFDLTKTPTEDELISYKAKDVDALGQIRFNEIKRYMQKKRDSYLRMMGSPSPRWMKNIGSALNFLDDANDTLGTAAMAARFTARLVPRAISKLLMGPAGWLLTGAEIINVVSQLAYTPMTAMMNKRALHDLTSRNPFSKQARVARASKLKKLYPTKGEIIEGLQTTDNIFGLGLCLGPIMGFIQDLAFGTYRVATGHTVKASVPPMYPVPWMGPMYEGLWAVQALLTENPVIDDDTFARCTMASYASIQLMRPWILEWNPLDEVEGLQYVIKDAPPIVQPPTLYLLEEEGIDPNTVRGFPQTDTPSATYEQLWDASADKIVDCFHGFAARQKNTYLGWMTAQYVSDIAEMSLANAEGEEQVLLSYDPVEKVCHKMLDSAYKPYPLPAPTAFQSFSDWVNADPAWVLSLRPQDLADYSIRATGVQWLHQSRIPPQS